MWFLEYAKGYFFQLEFQHQMIFKVHSRYESQVFFNSFNDTLFFIPQITYVFKDYRGLSEWEETYNWCCCFNNNDYNYFYWTGLIS